MNPLVGPQLESNLIRVMQYEWLGIDPEHHHVSNVPWSTSMYEIYFGRVVLKLSYARWLDGIWGILFCVCLSAAFTLPVMFDQYKTMFSVCIWYTCFFGTALSGGINFVTLTVTMTLLSRSIFKTIFFKVFYRQQEGGGAEILYLNYWISIWT